MKTPTVSPLPTAHEEVAEQGACQAVKEWKTLTYLFAQMNWDFKADRGTSVSADWRQ